MKLWKYAIWIFPGLMAHFSCMAQRILSEARINYSITAIPEKGTENLAAAFKDAGQILWLRGNLARVDFSSSLRLQSIIYNGATGKAVTLRESGVEKYQWNLDSAQWRQFNRKWTVDSIIETGEKAEIAGQSCKKVWGLLPGGDTITLYYTADLLPLAHGYEPMFEKVKGLPVQYEWNIEGLRIIYTLTSIQTGPVGASRFDIPKTGYKIMEVSDKRPPGNFIE